jgi:SAM-dependent methyltransferase
VKHSYLFQRRYHFGAPNQYHPSTVTMTMIHNHRTITSQPYTNTMATVPEISSAAEDEQQQSSQWTGDVWIQDHWTEEDKAEARGRLAASSRFCRGGQDANDCELRQQQQAHAFQQFRRNASTNWNVFYHQNTTNFFKDRHYLQKSFPNEFGWLYDMTNVGDAIRCDPGGTENETSTAPAPPVDNSITKAEFRIVEVGCGVGNAILPLLEQHSKLMQQYTKELNMSSSDEIGTPSLRPCPPKFHIHCLDFAPNAIQLLKKDTRFQAAAMEGRATAHVYDLSSMHPSSIDIGIDHADFPTQLSDNTSTQTKTHQSLANSADVAILLFCLSAIGPHPSPALRRAAQNVIDMLRPGGTLVIRDYGRLDEGIVMNISRADVHVGILFQNILSCFFSPDTQLK